MQSLDPRLRGDDDQQVHRDADEGHSGGVGAKQGTCERATAHSRHTGSLGTCRSLSQLAQPLQQPDHAHGVDGAGAEQGVAEVEVLCVEYGLNVGRYLQVPTFRPE